MRNKLGANYLGNNETNFTVWAPFIDNLELVINGEKKHAKLQKDQKGYWSILKENTSPGTLYKYKIDGSEFPDPASRSQPRGVHSWSEVVQDNFNWTDSTWKGIPVEEMIIYEVHIGTFTDKGTFEAVIEKLDYLLELGINTIEIMPIAQFPGDRNWGYDGVYPYAVQNSYGGVMGLKKLIDSCHNKGLAVVLDVVYNHMGPEGNYLSAYGPYFTKKYTTPWGQAINFDDEYADEVRYFFIQNVLMWLGEFHFDGLRLDAIHEIIDRSAFHFLKELSLETDKLQHKLKRELVLIAESDLNDPTLVQNYDKGGYGLEAQWVDDFHHSIHTLLTGENSGYYKDYGKIAHFAKAFQQGFIYDGIYSSFRKKTVGNSPAGLPPDKFVVCIQNHDQTGNRMLGERLSSLVSFEELKLAAAALLISPYVPLLFMGEEFAEENPFLYFIDHGDEELVNAVRKGRKQEFEYFFNTVNDFTDPQAVETYQKSKLNWNFKSENEKVIIFNYYKHLIFLRKKGAFKAFRHNEINTHFNEGHRYVTFLTEGEEPLFAAFNFGEQERDIPFSNPQNTWQLLFASADKTWKGSVAFSDKLINGKEIPLPGKSMLICKSI